jgi:hypothetical protein
MGAFSIIHLLILLLPFVVVGLIVLFVSNRRKK